MQEGTEGEGGVQALNVRSTKFRRVYEEFNEKTNIKN